MTEHETNPAALTKSYASKAEDAVPLSGVVSEAIHRAVMNGQEAWVRVSTEPHLRSVEAVRNESGGGWSVSVAAMKIVRPEHAACRDLREAIEDAIKRVPGVTEVEREVNEVWWASGYRRARTSREWWHTCSTSTPTACATTTTTSSAAPPSHKQRTDLPLCVSRAA